MSTKIEIQPQSDRELVICRLLDAPRESVYRGWVEPELMKKWFTPPPWITTQVEVDVRPGGSSFVLMQGPEGQELPNRGVYLEVIPGRKLVFTNAYTKAWEPSDHPFMTVVLTFEDADGGKTKYTARALHWTRADRDAHEKMGFSTGWAICADQLEALAKKL
jgi:uncharacterized protein YndB with AHSA1/START domain